MNPFAQRSQDRRARRRGRAAWLLLGLLILWPAEARAQRSLPPWLDSNMVLQRPAPSIPETNEALWGWAGREDAVTVELGSGSKPLRVRVRPVTGEATAGRWALTYRELRGELPLSSKPFDVTVLWRQKKETQKQTLTNVVMGEVWVYGQRPALGLPVSVAAQRATCSRARGRVRLLQARTIDWQEPAAAIRASWREWDDSLCAEPGLANVTWGLARALAEQPGDGVVGLIVADYDASPIEFANAGVRVELMTPEVQQTVFRVPEVAFAWQAATRAAREAASDCQTALAEIEARAVQLKWEGKTFDTPPPLRIRPPEKLALTGIPSLSCPVRGGIW